MQVDENKKYLNAIYGENLVSINLSGMGRITDVKEKIKSLFGHRIPGDIIDIQLWTNHGAKFQITKWKELQALTSTYFEEDGAAVVIKLADQGLIY